jgi:hypothetical protein
VLAKSDLPRFLMRSRLHSTTIAARFASDHTIGMS